MGEVAPGDTHLIKADEAFKLGGIYILVVDGVEITSKQKLKFIFTLPAAPVDNCAVWKEASFACKGDPTPLTC